MDNFEEYLRQGEPNKAEKVKVWKTAIGLQQVDGLKPSDYLIETARQNIEGDITIEEVKLRIDSYYKQHPIKNDEIRTEEADKVSPTLVLIFNQCLINFSTDYKSALAQGNMNYIRAKLYELKIQLPWKLYCPKS